MFNRVADGTWEVPDGACVVQGPVAQGGGLGVGVRWVPQRRPALLTLSFRRSFSLESLESTTRD